VEWNLIFRRQISILLRVHSAENQYAMWGAAGVLGMSILMARSLSNIYDVNKTFLCWIIPEFFTVLSPLISLLERN
jgi:hypothetical protein